ncbi:MAG: hypothetical protein WEG36_07420 [Gemmatimonadota bacterium]
MQNVTSPSEITGLTEPETHYFVVTASHTGGESGESAGVSAAPEVALNPQANIQLAGGSHTVTSMNVPAGVTVTLTGPVVIHISGDAILNGTVTGNCPVD